MQRSLSVIVICLVLFFGLKTNLVLAQDTALIDSLKLELKNSQSDSARIYWLQRLTWNHIINDTKQAEEYNSRAKELALKRNDERAVARAFHYEGLINRFYGNYPKAIESLEKALAYFEANNIEEAMLGSLFNLGVVHGIIGNYETSLEYYYRQMELNEKQDNIIEVGNTLNSIGSINRKMGNYDEAMEKFDRAAEIFISNDKPWNLANVLSNKGGVYLETEKFELAKKHFLEALEIDRNVNDNWGIAYNLHRLGLVMHETGKIDSAVLYLNEALFIRESLNQELELSETMLALGSAKFDIGRHDEGIQLIKDAMLKSEQIGAMEAKTTAHFKLAEHLTEISRFEEAYAHLKQYAVLRDSVLNKEKQRIASDMEKRYESVKKDRQIAENALELADTKAEIERKDSFIKLIGFTIVALLIILVLVIVVFNERKKNNDQRLRNLQKEQELLVLKSVIVGEEKERTRIAKDLHDGLSSLLAAIKIRFNAVQQNHIELINDKKFGEALTSLDDASKELRRIAHNMMPEILLKYGLVEALNEYVQNLNDGVNIQIEFTHYGMEKRLAANTELVLYRIIQELLNNVFKHSNASEVLMQINRNGNQLNITVEDNGKGFDISQPKAGDGIGMSNLASRVGYLKGELNIESAPNHGTTVYIEITLDKTPAEL
jgi:two-component system, NarL family, sensor kinase